MKRYRKLAILALVVGLAGALLATAGAASGSVAGAKLDLQANDSQGDRFVLIQGGSSTHTQTLTKQGACGISSGESELVALTATANSNNSAPGLKDHIFGVKAQGEGNGTPCSRIDGSAAGRGEQLVIEFAGPTIGNWYADYAQFGIKLKFGATGRIQALLNGEPVLGLVDTVTCAGSDCGPDSGNDRELFTLTAGTGQLFNGVRISVDSPSDGSISLLDDPDANLDSYFMLAADNTPPVIEQPDQLIRFVDDPLADPGATVTDDFDPDWIEFGAPVEPSDWITDEEIITAAGSYELEYNATDSSGNQAVPVFRDVIVYNGSLICGGTASAGDGFLAGTFTRLETTNEGVATGCDQPPKPYNLSVAGATITFEPFSPLVTANYRGNLTFDTRAPTTPQLVLQYDRDADGPDEEVNVQACNLRTADLSEVGIFPELGTTNFPDLTTLPNDTDGKPATWCLVAVNTVSQGGGQVLDTFVVFGTGDPRFSGN